MTRDASSLWRTGLALVLCGALIAGCGGDDDDDDDDGPSRNPQLSALVLSSGELDPIFDSEIFDYTSEVANEVTEVTVIPTTADPAATVTVDGDSVASGSASDPIALEVGAVSIVIEVTAENGTTQRAYTVAVTRRPPPSSNANLANLSLSSGPLEQIFDPDVRAYTAAVGYLGASTRVVATAEDSGATVTVAAGGQDPAPASRYVPLEPGATDIDVEAIAEDGIASERYSIEVTRADAATLDQRTYLKASNPGRDGFAASLALAADTLAVGAPGEDGSSSGIDGDDDDASLNAGAVYLFERRTASWFQDVYLKASNTGAGDRFGEALALTGDLLAVGAPGESSLDRGIDGDEDDDSGFDVGAVYLFERDGMDLWSQTAYVKAANADGGDAFGIAVDAALDRLVVGADQEDGRGVDADLDPEDNTLSNAGAAYLFARDDDGGWRQEAYLKAANSDSGDRFGGAVAISGERVAVAAPFESSQATGVDGDDGDDSVADAGAVYLFDARQDGWTQTAYLKASNTDPGDRFGTALDLDDNLLAVGAPGEDSNADGVDGDGDDDSLDASGAVYLFERDAAGDWGQVAYLKASNPGSQDGFGSTLRLQGNLLVVAAPGENSAAAGVDGEQFDESALNSGAVYLFERLATGDWVQIGYLKAGNTDGGDAFGSALAFDGDTLVSGAPQEDSGDAGVDADALDDSLPDAGAAYVFR